MMKFLFILLAISLIGLSCIESTQSITFNRLTIATKDPQEDNNTIKERYRPEKGYQRQEDVSDFGKFLRLLKLKPEGSLVKYYDETDKQAKDVYSSVIDLPIGNKNLHQCADAVIRLRADYLFKNERYNEIHFNLTNGFRVDFEKWSQGYRVKVEGNKTTWVKIKEPSLSPESYWKYLEFVFTYAGTLSLAKELEEKFIGNATIGDVFIQGGSPGHAIIIVDEISHIKSGKKMYLLAQSYMPAQDLQILINPKTGGSWYSFEKQQTIITPEWQFSISDLKCFQK